MMSYRRILAYPLGISFPLYIEIFKKLKTKNYFDLVKIFSFDEQSYRILKKLTSDIYEIEGAFINLNSIPIVLNLNESEFEKKYGNPNLGLWEITHYRNPQPSRKLIDYLSFWEKIFDEEMPDMVVTSWPAHELSLAFYLVAYEKKIKIVIPSNARIRNSSILRNGNKIESILDIWPGLEDKYLDYCENGISEEIKRKQKEKVKDFIENRRKPIWINTNYKKDIKRRIKDRLYNFKISFIKDYILRKINPIITKKFYDSYPDEFFIFFPLHVEPELSMDLLAPFFRNQLVLIEYIHQSLPAGIKLLVKEHPNMSNKRESKFFSKIKKNKKIILIDKTTDSHKILADNNCKGVVTITSSAGFEAMFYQKPVIVFGSCFYNVAKDLVYRLTDLTKLPEILQNLTSFSFNQEKFICFLAALESITFEGVVGSTTGSKNEKYSHVLSKKNIQNFVDEFLKRYPAD